MRTIPLLLTLFVACTPSPQADGPMPPSTAPSAASAAPVAPANTTAATVTPSGTAAPRVAMPYTGSITLEQVQKGIDALCAGVDKDLESRKGKKYSDGVALLLDIGTIGIRVHDEFYSNFLATTMGVTPDDLLAWFEAPERESERAKLEPVIDKVKGTFAGYKAFGQEREKGLPTASKASCEEARRRHTKLSAEAPAEGAPLNEENLDTIARLIVATQATKKCEQEGL